MNEDVTVIPTQQLKAMMAILQSRRIQEPREVVMSDDAGHYLRTRNFLYFIGLRPNDPMWKMIIGVRTGSDLSRAASGMDPYLRLQMIAAPELEDEYIEADPRVYSHGPGGAADAPAGVCGKDKPNPPPKGGGFA